MIMCHQQYIVSITSNAEITPNAIKKHLMKCLTGFLAGLIGLEIRSIKVQEYIPPNPIMNKKIRM